MIQREHNQFKAIKRWDSDLHNAVLAFKREHGAYPNILLASDKTLDAIDRVSNAIAPGSFFGLKDNKVVEKPFGEIGGLSAFSTGQYKIEFCVDNKIPFSGYALVRDPYTQTSNR